MANYKETTLEGNTWQRCKQVVIENPLGKPALVRFDEEKMISMSVGAQVRRDLGSLVLPFTPSAVIELRDFETGEFTGETVTHGDVYNILYSAYLGAAMARDDAAKSTEEPTTGGAE